MYGYTREKAIDRDLLIFILPERVGELPDLLRFCTGEIRARRTRIAGRRSVKLVGDWIRANSSCAQLMNFAACT